MFSPSIVIIALALVCVGQTYARPMPYPLQRAALALERREAAPLGTIPIYVREDVNNLPAELATSSPNGDVVPYSAAVLKDVKAKRGTDQVLEQAARSPGIEVERYIGSRRADTNEVPAELATSSPNGDVVPYSAAVLKDVKAKRADTNEVPAELATSSPNGDVVPYSAAVLKDVKAKRADTNDVPAEIATSSPNGDVVPYSAAVLKDVKAKRADTNEVPAELATSSPNGDVVPYSAAVLKDVKAKRDDLNTLPAELATSSPKGDVVPYSAAVLKGTRDLGIPSEVASRSLDGTIELY
jgi:hypothetical protein